MLFQTAVSMGQLRNGKIQGLGKDAYSKHNGSNRLQFIPTSWDNCVQFIKNSKMMGEIAPKHEVFEAKSKKISQKSKIID
jgi:hypothetical protein